MFHADPESRKEIETLLADFQGDDATSGLVGVMLWERDGEISELEAWSIDGSEVSRWPQLDTLRPFEVTRIK